MQAFFLIISLIINPYILLLINSSVININFPKIYSFFIVIYFFIFTNLRNHMEGFLYVTSGDDADDYILGGIRIMNNYSIFDILSGKADGPLEHIDRIFALFQLFLVKIFPPSSLPIIFNITFGILFILTLYTIPFISKGLVNLKSNLLISIIIINPYIIYLNQHLFRQAIALGVFLSFCLPYLLNFCIKENNLKITKSTYTYLLLSILLALGLHRGSIIPMIILICISVILSSGILKQIYILITKLVLNKKKFLLTVSLLGSSLTTLFFTKKYMDIFLIYAFYNLNSRSSSVGLRTSLLGFLISLFVIYTVINYPLKEIFKPFLKKVILNFAIINLLISIFCILTQGGFVRFLFSSNILSLFVITLTHNFNRKLFNIFTISVGSLTYFFYVFLREGFWGKGNYFLPYFY